MSKVFLHTGLHKTGTTAIQTTLFTNREALAEQGYRVPVSGVPTVAPLGHHELAWALNRSTDLLERWQDLRKEMAEDEISSWVLTSEELCALKAEHIVQVRRLLSDHDVTVIIYLRNQVDLAESLYRTDVLHYSLDVPLKPYIEHARTRLDYQSLLDDWCGAFGRTNVVIRLYEKTLLPEGVVPDFFRIIGADHTMLDAPTQDINHGLPFDAIIPIRQMRRRGVPANLINKYIAWAYANSTGRFTYLSCQEAEDVMAGFAASNQAVARQFFGRDVLFSEYAQRGKEPLNEMVVAASALARVLK